ERNLVVDAPKGPAVVGRRQDQAALSDGDHTPVAETLDRSQARGGNLVEAPPGIGRPEDALGTHGQQCARRGHDGAAHICPGREIGLLYGAYSADVEPTRFGGWHEHAERARADATHRLANPGYAAKRLAVGADCNVAFVPSGPEFSLVIARNSLQASIGLGLDAVPGSSLI